MNLKLRNKLRKLFNKHDPIGIYENKDVNFDEYDPEISGLIIRFKRSKNEDEFLDELYIVFKNMFSERIAGSKNRYTKLAKEIYNLCFFSSFGITFKSFSPLLCEHGNPQFVVKNTVSLQRI